MTLSKEKLKMLVVVTVLIMLNIPSIRSSPDLCLRYYSLPLLLVLIPLLFFFEESDSPFVIYDSKCFKDCNRGWHAYPNLAVNKCVISCIVYCILEQHQPHYACTSDCIKSTSCNVIRVGSIG